MKRGGVTAAAAALLLGAAVAAGVLVADRGRAEDWTLPVNCTVPAAAPAPARS
jgi:hypothetical protein